MGELKDWQAEEIKELWAEVERLREALRHIRMRYTPNGDLALDIEKALKGGSDEAKRQRQEFSPATMQ